MATPSEARMTAFFREVRRRLEENDHRDPSYREVEFDDLFQGILMNLSEGDDDWTWARKNMLISAAAYCLLLWARLDEEGI